MRLFAALKKIREFEKGQMPFLKLIIDFDIVIEIGHAEEEERPLTLKQLFLLNITSRTTVRRRLTKLIEQGIVVRRKHKSDQRSALLTISSSGLKVLGKYGGTLTAITSAILP